MLGHLHRVARWLRLALACLVLAGSGASAYVPPSAEAPVAVLVERRAPTTQRGTVAAPAHVQADIRGGSGVLERVWLESSLRESHAPSPPRRLFLLHRALLH
jgi:hypothetical protein